MSTTPQSPHNQLLHQNHKASGEHKKYKPADDRDYIKAI